MFNLTYLPCRFNKYGNDTNGYNINNNNNGNNNDNNGSTDNKKSSSSGLLVLLFLKHLFTTIKKV